ncbi:MAG TPA: aldehyde dehydrogenase (NADP(+)) [Thermoanaerobaculia bacterium]|jgi:alpha-ketoglutaric semialdehyde dehydrogenase|nr:aldehyde dehydrogenase (NADP(+)) [Thermoanaerobaculia bacterium]
MNDVDRAARAAAAAFASYGRLSGSRKGEMLRAIAANLEANGEAIVTCARSETALGLPRLQGELARTCNQLRMFAALVEEGSWVGARIDHGNVDIRSMLRPLGPVAVFGASNFPLAFSVAGGDTASALAAGCPVIVKAHPAHPRTSALAGEAIAAVVPEGVFALMFDEGYEAGIALVKHPLIKAAGFTGSLRGGRALMDIAASRPEPIPVFAEMGSINPVFILPRALQERGAEIAAGLHASVTLGVGQFCTNPGLVVTSHDEKFVGDLEARIAATPGATMLTPAIRDAYRAGVASFASIASRRAFVDADGGAALFTTDAENFLAHRELRDELFGPSTLVVECDSREHLLEVAHALEGQLTVTIHAAAGEIDEYRDLLEIVETKAGRIVFNGYPTGVEVVPAMVHGGPYPATSDGRSTSVGTRAIERFTRPVAWQSAPEAVLPDELKESNPLRIERMVDGRKEQS